MTDELITHDSAGLANVGSVEELGRLADLAAADQTFKTYRAGRAKNTRVRQANELRQFQAYLESKGVAVGDLANDPAAWRGVSFGLVTGFQLWLVGNGYAIGSVNVKLSTIRQYATLAGQAGAIDPGDLARILNVNGYRRKEGKSLDALRAVTRVSTKKTGWVTLNADQVKTLKNQPDTPQGRRDALLMCLLLDHGLRLSEVAILERAGFDLRALLLRFYRPKIDIWQTHKLTADTARAANVYLELDAPPDGLIWRGSRKTRGGLLYDQGWAMRAIRLRVRELGRAVGEESLSPHDCRHTWATRAAKKSPAKSLQLAGGWHSAAMALRYVSESEIANDGIVLD